MALEMRHVILGIHTAVGFAFFGLATVFFLNGALVGAGLRAGFGVLLLLIGVYFYRERTGGVEGTP